MKDVFEELNKQIVVFDKCMEQLNEKNTNSFSEEIAAEARVLGNILALLNSEIFKRAAAKKGSDKVIRKIFQKKMMIGSSLNELNKIYTQLSAIAEKQATDENAVVREIKNSMPNENVFNDFSELITGNLFMNYYMSSEKAGKN